MAAELDEVHRATSGANAQHAALAHVPVGVSPEDRRAYELVQRPTVSSSTPSTRTWWRFRRPANTSAESAQFLPSSSAEVFWPDIHPGARATNPGSMVSAEQDSPDIANGAASSS
jgi:hypothetical protein